MHFYAIDYFTCDAILYKRIYVCVCAHTYVHIYSQFHTHARTRTHSYIQTYVYMCICVCARTCVKFCIVFLKYLFLYTKNILFVYTLIFIINRIHILMIRRAVLKTIICCKTWYALKKYSLSERCMFIKQALKLHWTQRLEKSSVTPLYVIQHCIKVRIHMTIATWCNSKLHTI